MTGSGDALSDHDAMGIALVEASAAGQRGEVPIGAVVVRGDEVLATAGNAREASGDPTAHAELTALRAAAAAIGSSRLDGATLFATIEPCPMCAGAAVLARVARVVFGAPDLKAGACGSLYNLGADPRLNHEFAVTSGVRADECAALMSAFFAERRS